MKKYLFISLIAASFAFAGCVSSDKKKDDELSAGEKLRQMRENKKSIPSTIVFVNKDLGYVLLENLVKHEPGTRLVVFRDEQQVGMIMVTKPARSKLITANRLAGELVPGDLAYPE
jgi:hypothetical protein